MGKKRKTNGLSTVRSGPVDTKYDIEERFDDSEDDFHTGRDQILLEDGPATKRRKRVLDQEKEIQHSDEEVLAYSESDDEVEDEQSAVDGSEIESEENWGTTRADYYNTDVIETEADAIDEENEAKRIRQKQLMSITEADFGLDETAWTQSKQPSIVTGSIVERLPDALVPANATQEQMVGILHNRYPEFEQLTKDLSELQSVWSELRARDKRLDEGSISSSTARTKFTALSAYLGAIAMYLAVITSTTNRTTDSLKITALAPSELREHSIIRNLMLSRQAWNAVKDMKESQEEDEEIVVPLDPVPITNGSTKIKAAGPKTKERKIKQMRAESPESRESSDLDDLDDMSELPSKPQKRALIDVQSLLAKSTAPEAVIGQDFGDEEPLTEVQAADKARKKKSLRFYTSQIAQKANKRGAASREAGGDDDVPRKERLRDKQERLLKDAERRGNERATGDEELGGDSDDEVQNPSGDGYYDSLVSASKEKKAQKQARAEAYAAAARQGARVQEEEQVGPDGKRRITYAIEKNKGLTPKRKKDVRNPRVKKRKKYDEKLKKLGTVRQVYKGGEGRGGYKGELTGIKTNIVKSVKL